MTTVQKVIKYAALAFALFLALSIIGGIVSGVALIGGIVDSDATTDDLKTYEINPSTEILFLDVEIGAADFIIKESDSYCVKSNLKNLTVEEKNGTLTIKEKTSFGRYDGAALTLYLPLHRFEKAEIKTGAGRFKADSLNAYKLDLELGAGEVYIDRISVTSANIEGGAGNLTVAFGTIGNLDLDMGIGELNLNVELYGNNELDLGVGKANITLRGKQENYTVDIEKGLGSVTVNGENVSEYHCYGNGQGRVDIDGGIGAIHLNFKDD